MCENKQHSDEFHEIKEILVKVDANLSRLVESNNDHESRIRSIEAQINDNRAIVSVIKSSLEAYKRFIWVMTPLLAAAIGAIVIDYLR